MISIIDDDRSVREAVKSLIRSLGYEAVTFASAEEYLGADAAHDSECVITDVQMPGMTGMDFRIDLSPMVIVGRSFLCLQKTLALVL